MHKNPIHFQKAGYSLTIEMKPVCPSECAGVCVFCDFRSQALAHERFNDLDLDIFMDLRGVYACARVCMLKIMYMPAKMSILILSKCHDGI